jgi:hypothetical protein
LQKKFGAGLIGRAFSRLFMPLDVQAAFHGMDKHAWAGGRFGKTKRMEPGAAASIFSQYCDEPGESHSGTSRRRTLPAGITHLQNKGGCARQFFWSIGMAMRKSSS